jgi:CO/xanthine dehydrogenase FAD-binding subunit
MVREFFQPDTLVSALELRRDHEASSLLAGGTDLVVAMRNGRGPEGSIIDLSKVSELKGVEAAGDTVRIGPMTTFSELEGSEVLRNTASMLCNAASAVGSPQIRNRGTIGGNICNASAAADGFTPLLCLDAEVELQSMAADGSVNVRILPLESFIIDSGKTAIKGNEILTGIQFKQPSPDVLSCFRKIGRRNALAIARISGCCVLQLKGGAVDSIRFALGASTSKPERIKPVEEFLTGRELTREAFEEAGKLAAEYVLKQTGTRPSSSYKLPVIEKLTVSLIKGAAEGRSNL